MYITFTLCTLWTFYCIFGKRCSFFFSHVILQLCICLEHIWKRLIYMAFPHFLDFSVVFKHPMSDHKVVTLFWWFTCEYLPRVYCCRLSCLQKQLLENWKVCYHTTEGTKHSCLLHTACLPILPPRKICMKGGRVTCMKYAFIEEWSPWNKK